jgi:hypothetical protein
MTQFEENNPKQLKEFIKQFRMLMDEFHPNTYLIDDVWAAAHTIETAIKEQLDKINKA